MQPQEQPKRTSAAARMTLANVTRGKIEKPMRLMVFGIEGVGKSLFAAGAPNPIFLCAEDGTAHLDVARFPAPKSYGDVLEALRVLTHEPHDFGSCVIDTLDWLEPLIWAQVCAAGGQPNIEGFGYGKGYVLAQDVWRQFIARLETLERTRKMNIVLVAHAQVKKHVDPYAGEFSRFTMKLHEKSGDILREWVDAVFFARHEVIASEKKGRVRGLSSGARLMHTQWNAAFDAKNRFNLPETLPLDWQEFIDAKARASAPSRAQELRADIEQRIPMLPPERAEKARERLRAIGEDLVSLEQMQNQIVSVVSEIEKGEQA